MEKNPHEVTQGEKGQCEGGTAGSLAFTAPASFPAGHPSSFPKEMRAEIRETTVFVHPPPGGGKPRGKQNGLLALHVGRTCFGRTRWRGRSNISFLISQLPGARGILAPFNSPKRLSMEQEEHDF